MITMYSKKQCPFCDKAKAYMDLKKIKYEVIDVENTDGARDFLIKSGLRSVPQLFINGTLIDGGYTGLIAYPLDELEVD